MKTDDAANAGPPDEILTDTEIAAETRGRSPPTADPAFALTHAQRLDPGCFPHQPRTPDNPLPGTIANVSHLLAGYGITVRYNVILKKLHIGVPGYAGAPDNADNVAIAHIASLANLNRVSSAQLINFVGAIGDRHQFNPVADWIESRAWDGQDRLQAFCDTLTQREDFSAPLKEVLLHRWLISAVAAALKPSGFRNRGVLTLQGPQSIGKTEWVRALVPDPILREAVLLLDHHLDAGNKDSIITAVCHWIVEIGELDSSFKKDIARLKGFLTGDRDKVRRPYGRIDSEYQRRTVFCATVNDQAFLVDTTGNSRWWTIPVTKINYTHGIDMQQLFAQVAVDFRNGEPWWLDRNEEGLLEKYNQQHRAISAIHERVLDALDLDRIGDSDLSAMTPTQLLQSIGIKNPTNTQAKECAAILRQLLGESRRIKGQNVWRIPVKRGGHKAAPTLNDADDF